MADSTAPRTPSGVGGALTRRDVLKGMAAVAGTASLPALLAACGSAASPAPATSAAAPSASAPSASAPASASAAATGGYTVGSNYSDPVPKQAFQAMLDAFKAKTGITAKVNTVDHGTFQNQISQYLQGQPDDVFTWFSGFRMRFFAAQGLAQDVSDVWSQIGSNFSDAFKVGSTGDDGKQYFVPIYNYPWAIFYRKSVFAQHNYKIPQNIDELKKLAGQMQKDGLVPFSFGDKDGWPAMGTFDIINLRTNGYQFHVDLMAGKQKWTDPKVTQVFKTWSELLPLHDTGAPGRTWQDAAQKLVKKQAGMYLLGMFVSQQFKAVSAADLDDLDFFPYPDFGTEFDKEKALDAPIDGLMIAKNSPNLSKDLDAAKAFLEFAGTGAAQDAYIKVDPSNVAAAKDANTTGYSPLQKKAIELIGNAQRITQFLDRDTNPTFAGPNGMQQFLLKWIQNPNQDMNAFQKSIQDFWDSLG